MHVMRTFIRNWELFRFTNTLLIINQFELCFDFETESADFDITINECFL